jgi:hypothetical protein
VERWRAGSNPRLCAKKRKFKVLMIEKKSSRTLCLGCAQILPSSEVDFSCPACGFENNGPAHKRLLDYARAAVHYGYCYRGFYEDELEEHGEIPACNIGPAGEALTWLALAALSGIVGGASWELAGAAVRRIFRQIDKDEIGRAEVKALQDSEELKKFVLYIQDFVEVFRAADPRISGAVLTEMVIDEQVKLHLEEGAGTGATEDSEALAVERVKHALNDRPNEEDFREAWKNVDLSG